MKSVYIKILTGITSVVILFHFLILLKIIPYDIAWGGRLKTDEEMYVFEFLSILVNLFFIYVLIQKGKYIRAAFSEKTLTVILWIFFAVFLLNTLGNLLAKTAFEKTMSSITLLNALLLLKVQTKTS